MYFAVGTDCNFILFSLLGIKSFKYNTLTRRDNDLMSVTRSTQNDDNLMLSHTKYLTRQGTRLPVVAEAFRSWCEHSSFRPKFASNNM